MSEELLGSQHPTRLALIQDTEPDHHIRQLDNKIKEKKTKHVVSVVVLSNF